MQIKTRHQQHGTDVQYTGNYLYWTLMKLASERVSFPLLCLIAQSSLFAEISHPFFVKWCSTLQTVIDEARNKRK